MKYTDHDNFYIQVVNEDNSVTYIPKSESNSDYQEYLRSLDEPN
jgi:hypothetical protein